MDQHQRRTVKELSQFIQGKVVGDENILIHSLGSIFQGAPAGSITFIEDAKLHAIAEATMAAALIVPPGIETSAKTLIQVEHPKVAFAKIATLFTQNSLKTNEISAFCDIHPGSKIGQNPSIHSFAVISDQVAIGDDCIIGPGSYLGQGVIMGHNCEIHSNVVIEQGTVIGDNVIIHSGSIIGSDGFGFARQGDQLVKVPQLGNVIIHDHVEIFAGVTIDRGTIGATVIGKGSKLGDNVHVGHNVKVGENCILVAQVAVGGSTTIGNNCTLAGKVGISDHIEIGDNVVLTACSMALKDIPDGSVYSGQPAMDHKRDYKIKATARKLPDMLDTVRQLEKVVAQLEEKIKQMEQGKL